MSDSFADFNSRIARIEDAHAKGHGFEASGALGRSFYTRSDLRYRRRHRLPVLRPILLALVLGTLAKGFLLHHLGSEDYNARVASLMAAQGFDRLGGWLMQADPATTALAHQIALFGRLGD